jgi:hypothetical protein
VCGNVSKIQPSFLFPKLKIKEVMDKMEIHIRNLDSSVIDRLSDMAKSKGISLNAYLRNQLELLAEFPDLMERDSKYEELFNRILPILEKSLQMLASNNNLMDETKQTLGKMQKQFARPEEENGE